MADGGLVIPVFYDLTTHSTAAYRDLDKVVNELNRRVASKAVPISFKIDITKVQQTVQQLSTMMNERLDPKTPAAKWRKLDADINKALMSLKMYYNQLDQVPIAGAEKYKAQIAKMNLEWNKMANSAKFTDSTHTKLTAKARRMVETYNKVNALLEKENISIQKASQMQAQLAAQQERTALMHNQNLQTVSEAQMRVNLLQQEMNNTPINTAKWQALRQELAGAELQLKKMIETSARLQAPPATSIDAYNAKIAQLNAEWNKLSASAKTVNATTGQLPPTAARILAEYKLINDQLAKQGMSLSAIVAQENQRAAIVTANAHKRAILANKNFKTIAAGEERLTLLQEKFAHAQVGTAKWRNLQREIERTQARLSMIRGTNMNNVVRQADEMQKRFKLADGYLARILMRIAAYAGVSLFVRAIRSVHETTAEFELQKVALGALVQDAQRASEIFEQIKRTAVHSPFDVKSLVTYTKQLSAYRIESENLYDTTMKLADVSAGLGVSMDRLILAYGQVKATSYLRASEIRQFTEAGIPLIQMLADKLTKIRGELVSTGEVMQLVSERGISFRMVAEVFDEMTEAGGAFYRMQEIQAETLKGKITNLKDAYSIMLDEMGRTDTISRFYTKAIKGLSNMAKNWRDVARTVGNIIFAYIALHRALKLVRAGEQQHMMAMAGKVKMNKALTMTETQYANTLRASNRLTKAQIALYISARRSTLAAATATNVLKTSFHKAAAAIKTFFASMGPIGWVVLAVTAIYEAIRKISKRAETLQEQIDNAKQRAAEYIDLIKHAPRNEELLKSYDELSEKTDKTAEETAKLHNVQKSLLQLYPEAAKLIDAESQKYKINTEAIRKNTEEKQRNARAAINLDIITLTKRRDELEKELKKFDTKYTESGTPYLVRKDKTWDINKTRDEFVKLTKDLNDVNDALEQANKALDFSLVQAGLKDFDLAWKRQLRALSTVDGKTTGFADDIIENFSNIEEAWDKAAEEYKETSESIEKYQKSLETVKETKQREELEKTIARLKVRRDTMYAILKYYNQLDLLSKQEKGGTKEDVKEFKEELDLIKRIYKKYMDLRKLQSESDAQESIKSMYGDLTKIDFLTPDTLVARIRSIMARASAKLSQVGSDDAKDIIKNFLDDAAEEVDNVDYNELERVLKDKVENLAKSISTSKEANKFYDEIFTKTFSRGLAEAFTASVYGADRTSATNAIKDYVREVFGDVGLNAFGKQLIPNWEFLEGLIDESWADTRKEQARQIIETGRKSSEEQYRMWVSDLAKEKSTLDKRIDLHRQTVQRIREIEADANLDEGTRKELVEQYRKREQKMANDIAYEAFKDSPVYTQLFANLDAASVSMLQRLKKNVEGLKAEWGELDPSNLKELQKRIEEIDKQLVEKRPFEVLAKSLKEYYKYADRRKNADKRAIESAKITDRQQKNALEYAVQLEVEEQKLRDITEGRRAATEDERNSQVQIVSDLRTQTQYAKQLYENAKKRSDADAEDADYWRQIGSQIVSSLGVLASYSDQLTKLNDMVFRIGKAFAGADEIQKEFLDNMNDGINKMIGGVGTIAKGVGEIYGGNKVQGIIDVVLGLEQAIEGALDTADAKKLRDINREIKDQEEAINNLEKAYNRLREAEEKVFGTEWISNRRKEIDLLEAEAEAYRKKADAEMRKSGKDRDESQAREWYDKADDILEQIANRASEISQKFLGTDVASAARDFASAWIDAYKSFGNTIDAMDEKFHDMMENMVKESIMAKVVEHFLAPIFKAIDELDENSTTEQLLGAVTTALETYNATKGDLNDVMVAITNMLREAGFDLRDTVSGMTGISKDIATASEESILGLAAGINTQNFYISGIYASVTQIVEMLQGGSRQYAPARSEGGAGSTDYGTTLTTISGHTERIADDIADIKSTLNSVITVIGQTKRVRVGL